MMASIKLNQHVFFIQSSHKIYLQMLIFRLKKVTLYKSLLGLDRVCLAWVQKILRSTGFISKSLQSCSHPRPSCLFKGSGGVPGEPEGFLGKLQGRLGKIFGESPAPRLRILISVLYQLAQCSTPNYLLVCSLFRSKMGHALQKFAKVDPKSTTSSNQQNMIWGELAERTSCPSQMLKDPISQSYLESSNLALSKQTCTNKS